MGLNDTFELKHFYACIMKPARAITNATSLEEAEAKVLEMYPGCEILKIHESEHRVTP